MEDLILKKLDIILIILGIFFLLFTITMTVIFCVKDAVPDSLITGVYSASFIELIATACIKIAGDIIEKKAKIEEDDDDEY